MLIGALLLLVAPSVWACDLGDRVPVSIDGKEVRIDRCIAPIVKALNKAGIRTITSCCGHSLTNNGYIELQDRLLIVTPQTNSAAVRAIYAKQFERMGREMQQRRVAQMPDKSP